MPNGRCLRRLCLRRPAHAVRGVGHCAPSSTAIASSCAEQIGTIARRLNSAGAAQVAGLQTSDTLRTGSPRAVEGVRIGAPSDVDMVSTADHVSSDRALIVRAADEDRRGDKRACEKIMSEAKGMIGALPYPRLNGRSGIGPDRRGIDMGAQEDAGTSRVRGHAHGPRRRGARGAVRRLLRQPEAQREVEQGFVRDDDDGAGRQGSDAVVHDPEVQALVVRKVAWDVEGQDLPPALLQDLVAVGPAVDDEAALGGAVLLTKDVLMHAQSPPLDRQVLDSLPFDGRKGRIALQLAEERGEDGAVLEGHGRFTMLTGGSTRISRPPVPAVGSPTMASSLKPDQRARIT